VWPCCNETFVSAVGPRISYCDGPACSKICVPGLGRFINNQFLNPESRSAQMPAAFFNGAAFGRDRMTSVSDTLRQKETAPARGQLRPSLGCAEGAGRHGLLNRKSGDCSPVEGISLRTRQAIANSHSGAAALFDEQDITRVHFAAHGVTARRHPVH
jgi:hypothetical protein